MLPDLLLPSNIHQTIAESERNMQYLFAILLNLFSAEPIAIC
jgi:hypothetical protein